MELVESIVIGNIEAKIYAWQPQNENGLWAGQINVTKDYGDHIDDYKVYPDKNLYSSRDGLLIALREKANNEITRVP